VNSLPPALLKSLQGLPGFDMDAFKKAHEPGEQATSVRINPKKLFNEQLEKVPWNQNGFYLSSRPSFTLDPLFHAGAYYVQEASSMFLEEAIKQSANLLQPLKVLDLCAAPGGKSTLIQSLISDESLLVSNEIIKTRVNILSENITKWGAANVIVTNNDPKGFLRLENYFDIVVVDAPCSGSGLFRKDNEAIEQWSEQNVNLCAQRQQRILADIIPSLKEGGVLIYSTCSYSKKENEDVCDWLLKNYPLATIGYQLNEDWNIVETRSSLHNSYGYRFYPYKVKGEGFFIAGFKKLQATNDQPLTTKYRSKTEKLSAKEIDVIKPYLKNTGNYFFIKLKEEIIALPLHLETDLFLLQSVLYIKKAGVKIGTVIRNELIPHHELALSSIISDKIQTINIDEQTALQYLRRAEVNIDTGLKGWAILAYKNTPLGWIKILPGRINNYYPKEWRILNK
jgi:NOL1/NOP2/sun family putative RNA methylase